MDGLTKADPKGAQPEGDALTCHLGLPAHTSCTTACPPFIVISGQMARHAHGKPNKCIPATLDDPL
jgi:hypothetical protein